MDIFVVIRFFNKVTYLLYKCWYITPVIDLNLYRQGIKEIGDDITLNE